ncbi:hypothetical protein [Lacrimispora indolis]|uniref:hypothetical protein n=1 Tax=Lacrimispora indolis TaxID=69825 RepID=UPI000418C650|nr:hypothetical protein [[Clostridium] methoxybenzovorans]
MEESKNKVSLSQRKSQKKYDQKTKMISVKYTPFDMKEYDRVKNYLDMTGQSTNGFIKSLINNFFETDQDKMQTSNQVNTNPVIDKRFETTEYEPFSYIDEENIQYLYDKFGEEGMKKVLNEYFSCIDFYVKDIFEQRGYEFDEWVQDLYERLKDEEFQNKTEEEICKELIKNLYKDFA